MTGSAEHAPGLPPHRLDALERAVRRALADGRFDDLRCIGHGEVSCVLDWDGFACKRLPAFASSGRAEAYRACVALYVERLGRRGLRVLDTATAALGSEDGRTIVYCVQPRLPAETLALHLVRHATLREVDRSVEAIVAGVAAVVDDALGLDAQLANWAFVGGEPVYFDVTTPFLRGADGRPLLDIEVFIASLPWLARDAVRRFVADGLLARYHDLRGVLCDFAANLYREDGTAHLVSRVLGCVNEILPEPLSEREVHRYHLADVRLFRVLRGLRRIEARWRARPDRSPAGILLPSDFPASGR